MNWIDFVLIALLLTGLVVGAKKGLVRELSAFVIFFAAIILTLTYIDSFAVWVYSKLGGSPMVSAFVSFLFLLAFSYGIFKLAGYVFYKVASIKSQGKPDQVGGAIVGLVRGWVSVSFVVLVAFMLPLPDSFYLAFDSSFLGKAVAKTVPLMFESTKIVHPESPSFIAKMENTLIGAPGNGKSGKTMQTEDREQAYRVMYQIDRFFNVSAGT
jgi:uncharacterized membrane protein required for colicin V production